MALEIEVFGMPQGNKIDMNVAKKLSLLKTIKGNFFHLKKVHFVKSV